MKQYSFPDSKPWKIAFGLFLTAMLFLARDSMFTMGVIGFYKAQFLMLGLMGGALAVFLVVHRRRWKEILTDRRIAVALIMTAVILLPMLVKRDWQLMYFSVLLCLYFAVFMSYFISLKDLAKYYVAILTVLGAYSVLAAYVLRLGVDGGLYAVPVFYNANDIRFYNFFLSVVPDTYVKYRNFGIFREPGVYQFFLITALYLNNYAVSWHRPWKLWVVNGILALTMVSTFATGGMAEMALLAVVVFFDKKYYRDRRLRTAALILAALAVGVLAVSAILENQLYLQLYDMVIGKFQGGESGTDRIFSVLVNLQTFLKNPLFGEDLATVLHAGENNTSSTLILLAGFGILAGALHVAGWVALVWKKEQGILTNLALVGIVFLSFNTQNLIADVFFWLFPTMALVERGAFPLGKKRG